LRKLFTAVLITALALAIFGFFLPKSIHVERTIFVRESPEKIYAYLVDLKNWRQWSLLEQMDPKMRIVYSDPSAGLKASYTWHSEHVKAGSGRIAITETAENEKIVLYMRNSHEKVHYTFHFEPVENGTEITWAMDSAMGMDIVGRYFAIHAEKFVGPDLEKGLIRLTNAFTLFSKDRR